MLLLILGATAAEAKTSCSDMLAALASSMSASPTRVASTKARAIPIAFTTFLVGRGQEQMLPLRLMYASAQQQHSGRPGSCPVLLTDMETNVSAALSKQLLILRYKLPYPSSASERIPGQPAWRMVPKYICSNRLASEARFIAEVAAGVHTCAGVTRFHIALIDSDVLLVGSLAPLLMEHHFSVAFTVRHHRTMPINNGVRLVSASSHAGLQLAARFYSQLISMVHLMTATKGKGLEGFMQGPVFWYEQKATALVLGHDPRDPTSLAPFRDMAHATLMPAGSVLILPAKYFNHGLAEATSRHSTHPCKDARLRPTCGVTAIHFKSNNKCAMLAPACVALAGVGAEEAAVIQQQATAACATRSGLSNGTTAIRERSVPNSRVATRDRTHPSGRTAARSWFAFG